MTLQIYTNASGIKHDTGAGHPENPERLRALLELFKEEPFSSLPVVEAPQAKREWVARFHEQNYIDYIEGSIPDGELASLDGDTTISPATWDAALTAAGAVCQAVDDILNNKISRAFCAVRPPGHHAEPNMSTGFCVFNNIAIGALHAIEEHGIKRVAIVDFDVHHGNGTDSCARLHDGIFLASTHQWPLYPGTGLPQDNITGRVMNITLADGDGSDAFRQAYEQSIFPALDKYAPELIMISAGFDAHKDDPLAGLSLIDEDYTWITEEIVKIADKHCNGRIVSTLEGGYNLTALKSSASAHLKALLP